jgi:hypothetical protein
MLLLGLEIAFNPFFSSLRLAIDASSPTLGSTPSRLQTSSAGRECHSRLARSANPTLPLKPLSPFLVSVTEKLRGGPGSARPPRQERTGGFLNIRQSAEVP